MNFLNELLMQTSPIYWMFLFTIAYVIVDAFTKKETKQSINLFLLFVILMAFRNIYEPVNITESSLLFGFTKGMLNFSKLASVFDIIFCLAGFLVAAFAREHLSKVYENHKEFNALLLFSIFGMMCIAHSNNLIVLFLGIETMSIPFYVLTGFVRNREKSIEGALKYFLLGAFATGFLLYGIAMIYGATGSMYYPEIRENIFAANFNPLYLKLGIGLLIIGILFKIAAFPFHQWAPDAYTAASSPISGFMSTVGKVAALSGFIGILSAIMPNNLLENFNSNLLLNQNIQLIIACIAALTMLVGNITAISQKNIKRMLAYSSVGHAGYMLMGIIANNSEGTTGIIFYSLAYTFTQIGAFAVISAIEKKDEINLEIADYAGLAKSQPFLAAAMAMFMFSLAGIPPFAGFFGKYFLFKAAIEAGFTWLTIIAVITSVISVYFYLSVIVQMYFKEKSTDLATNEDYMMIRNTKFSVALSTFGIIIFGIFSNLVIDFVSNLF